MKRALAALAALAATLVVVVVVIPLASASSTGVTLNGSTAGEIADTSAGRWLTFMGAETNNTNKTVNENVVLVYVHNVKIHQPMECVGDTYGGSTAHIFASVRAFRQRGARAGTGWHGLPGRHDQRQE